MLYESLEGFEDSNFQVEQNLSYGTNSNSNKHYIYSTSNILLPLLNVGTSFVRREILERILRINNLFLLIRLEDLSRSCKKETKATDY